MKKTCLLLLVGSILAMSCVTLVPGLRGEMRKKGITTEYDDFNGSTKTIVNIPIGGIDIMAEASIGFKYIEKNDEKILLMYTFLYKNDWLFVDSVLINIDGEIIKFESFDNNREVVSGGYIQEYSMYQVDKSFLKQFANSDKVKIRLSGKDYYIDLNYKIDDKIYLKEFLSKIN